jgi:hypothetical protein
MTWASAPERLPLTPRPIPDETLSSWLLRVATANGASLAELVHGLESRYPAATRGGVPLDCDVPLKTLEVLARFCRAEVEVLRRMDLRSHASGLEVRFLLAFSHPLVSYQRASWCRARYAYCAACLLAQSQIHVRWDWCFAALTRCAIHRVALRDGCPHCGEEDPLDFGQPERSDRPCWSCRGVLADAVSDRHPAPDIGGQDVVADAYRWALCSVAAKPTLLGRATDGQFRAFVNDMLELLGVCLQQDATRTPRGRLRRQDFMTIVGDLVRNAAPSPDARHSRARRRRGVVLWTTLLALLSPEQGARLESTSRRWPAALQRRLEAAILARTRRRWPYPPYSPVPASLRSKVRLLGSVHDLGDGRPQSRHSGDRDASTWTRRPE